MRLSSGLLFGRSSTFRYDMFATKKLEPNPAGELVAVDQPYFPWDTLLGDIETARTDLSIDMRDAHLLPEAYFMASCTTWQFAQLRTAFLNGEYSLHRLATILSVLLAGENAADAVCADESGSGMDCSRVVPSWRNLASAR